MGKKLTLTITLDADEVQALFPQVEAEPETADEEENEDFDAKPAPKKSTKKAQPAADFDDSEEDAEESDADGDETADDSGDEESEVGAPKKGKKALTSEDINDACKKKVHGLIDKGMAGPEARKRVFEILQKKFKVKSIVALKPAQYPDVLKALA